MSDAVDDLPALPDNVAAPDAFIDKWLARWPEWAVVQVFVPPARRSTLLAWAALQQELGDAAWGGSDARPGEAKLGWWQEELQGWGRGLRRHPLGALLQSQPGDWRGLAEVLPLLRDSRERPVDAAAALAQVQPIARAFSRIDAALEGGAPSSPFATPSQRVILLTSQQLLHARLLLAGEAAVPLQELAHAGQGDATAAWARRVPGLGSVPHASNDEAPARGGAAGRQPHAHGDVSRFRRITAALAQGRLLHGDAARPLPAWRALWGAWQAARN